MGSDGSSCLASFAAVLCNSTQRAPTIRRDSQLGRRCSRLVRPGGVLGPIAQS